MGVSNTSEAILNVLKGNKEPMNADEIAFRIRSGRSVVTEVLQRMLKVNMVRQTATGFQLNPQKEYNLLQAFR